MAEKPQANADKLKVLSAVMDKIEKDFGKGSIMRMNSSEIVDVPVIPTGSITLDMALGVGGYPKGRVVEIYGPESSGKTTLAIHAIAEAQKAGGIAAFIDAEMSSVIEPVGMTGMSFTSVLFMRMIEPLPKSFSIFCITASSTLSLSAFICTFSAIMVLFCIINFVSVRCCRTSPSGGSRCFAALRRRVPARDGDLGGGSDS